MTAQNSTEQPAPQSTQTAGSHAPPTSARPAALIELALLLQRIKELFAELPPDLPQDGVDTLMEATVRLLHKEQDAPGTEVDGLVSKRKYGEAEEELNQENQRYLGLTDVLKNMLLWKETPEERVRKHEPLSRND